MSTRRVIQRKGAEPQPSGALASWKTLNAVIKGLSERELTQLLEVERANKRRANILRRLHQRLTRLRMLRERSELRSNP